MIFAAGTGGGFSAIRFMRFEAVVNQRVSLVGRQLQHKRVDDPHDVIASLLCEAIPLFISHALQIRDCFITLPNRCRHIPLCHLAK